MKSAHDIRKNGKVVLSILLIFELFEKEEVVTKVLSLPLLLFFSIFIV